MLFGENNFNADYEEEQKRMQNSHNEEDVIDRREEQMFEEHSSLEDTTHLELPPLQDTVVTELDEESDMVIQPSTFNVGKDTVRKISNDGLSKPKTLVRRLDFRMAGPRDRGFSAIASITALVALGGIIVFYLLLKV